MLNFLFGSKKYAPYIDDEVERDRDFSMRLIASVKENKPMVVYSPEDNLRHARDLVSFIESGSALDPLLIQYIWLCSKAIQDPENQKINGVLDWCKNIVDGDPENFIHCSIDVYS